MDGIRHPGMVGHACHVEIGRAVDSRIGNGLRGPLLSTGKSPLIPLRRPSDKRNPAWEFVDPDNVSVPLLSVFCP